MAPAMRVADTVVLDRAPGTTPDIRARILARARDKRVLNVGAAGGVTHYLPQHREQWLHAALAEAAADAVGIDVDAEAIAHAARHGYALIEADCQALDLPQRFDLILMSDVIEHLDRPAEAVRSLAAHLAPEGELWITTPNAGYFGHTAAALRGRAPGIYWDHVACYLPEHLQALCDRHGLMLAEVSFFSFIDQRSARLRLKSGVVRALAALAPRLHNSFLAVIRAR
jgi:2-polyprenyl-3-methyl-5-hydroxy-6-metoxy-1,4-benzoquinol methylase